MSKVEKFLGVPFLVIGLLALFVAAFIGIRAFSIVQTGEEVDAVVVAVNEGAPTVRYSTLENAQYTHRSSWSTNPPAFRTGDTVSIYYNPEDPESVIINTFMGLWLAPLFFAGFAIVFGGIGASFLILGMHRRYVWNEVKTQGIQIQADFIGVQQNTSVKINGRSPFVIMAQYHHESKGVMYVFKSENIWFDPTSFLERKTIAVWVDPHNYKRYYVDVSTLPKEIS